MKFPENLFALLPAKLELLITEYSALSQLRKAVRLRTILGNVLLAADFVCDARPVFNTEQNRIDSMLAMTTLRLEIESQSGDKKCVEVMLSEHDLGELIEKGQKAQSKIEVINNAINNSNQSSNFIKNGATLENNPLKNFGQSKPPTFNMSLSNDSLK